MLALDADPELRAKALGISVAEGTNGLSVVEAEACTITGNGTVVRPLSSWTGEANISGGAFVALSAGGSVSIPLPAADQPSNIFPIVNQAIAPSGTTTWTSAKGPLGTTANGGAGVQGITDAPGILFPFTLRRALAAGLTSVTASTDGQAALDALLVQPLISTVRVSGSGGDTTLYVSAAKSSTVQEGTVPEGFVLVQHQYDSTGQPVKGSKDHAGSTAGRVMVSPGGFTLVTLTAG